MSSLDNYSENEDDPEVGESSGEEWTNEVTKPKTRRTSKRLSKKSSKSPKGAASNSTDSSADDEPKKRTKSNSNKRQKTAKEKPMKVNNRKNLPKTIFADNYLTGSFVILKRDAQVGDKSYRPCIWRIDGKALLQKYEPLEEDGQIRHKSTSIYTAWSVLEKDLYAPVAVDCHQGVNVVNLHWEQLKEINMDSD